MRTLRTMPRTDDQSSSHHDPALSEAFIASDVTGVYRDRSARKQEMLLDAVRLVPNPGEAHPRTSG